MDENSVRKYFPNASPAFVRLNTDSHRTNRHIGNSRDNPLIQDAKDSIRMERQRKWENLRKASHAARAQRMDAANRPKFRISVTFRFPDYRIHDPDGCYSTILDCLIAARRLLVSGATNESEKRTVRIRKRGGNNHDREAVEKLPF